LLYENFNVITGAISHTFRTRFIWPDINVVCWICQGCY